MKVFVSSTRDDLDEHRRTIKTRLERVDQEAVLVEDRGPDWVAAVSLVEWHISQCAAFVGIYAFRYGHVLADGTGITEYEFHVARRLGLRCLCFCADESLRPAVPLEGPRETSKLQNFKERLAPEIVFGPFRGIEDLSDSVVDAILKLDRGRPLGVISEDVLAGWTDWQGERRARLLDLGVRPGLAQVPPPLGDRVAKLLRREPWHMRVGAARDDIVERLADQTHAGEPDDERRAARARLSALATDGRYATIRQAVRTTLDDPVLRSVAGEPGIVGVARNLAALADAPRYDVCLLVSGSRGSGKTHLVAAVLAGEVGAPPGTLVLDLDPPDVATTLAELVRSQAEIASGVRWRSLAELDEFLVGAGWHLFVAVDDMHLWHRRDDAAIKRLTELVAESTRLHSIRWLLTIDETHLDVVLSEAPFWRLHGLTDDDDTADSPANPARAQLARAGAEIGGWARLDALNARARIGWRIYSEMAGRPAVELDDRLVAQLASPEIAWMAFELRQELELEQLLSLNFLAFSRAFWKQRVRLGLADSLTVEILDETARLVGRTLLCEPDRRRMLNELVADVAETAEPGSALRSTECSRLALGALRAIGTLRYQQREDPAAGIHNVVQRQVEPFWNWRMAQQIAALAPGGARVSWASAAAGADLRLRCAALGSQSAAEGVLEFLILIVDESGGNRGSTLDLCDLALGSRALPSAAAWLAGTRASGAAQRALAALDLGRGAQIADRRELFARAYFFAEARGAVKRPEWRLKALCTQLADIVAHGLEEYVGNACTRWIAATCGDDLPDAMVQLRGFVGPPGSVADRLGTSAANALLVASSGELDRCLTWMFAYARAERSTGERSGPGYRFRQWAMLRFCDLVFERTGVDGFAWLRQNGWYAGQGEVAVRHSMRAGADLAFGYWFRGAGDAQRAAYVALVDGLTLSQHHEDHLRAGYLIRRSVATYGRQEVTVDQRFCRALRHLVAMPHVRQRHGGLADLLRASCDDSSGPLATPSQPA